MESIVGSFFQVPRQVPQDGEVIPQASPARAIPRGNVPREVSFWVNGVLGVPLLQALAQQDIPGLDGANEDDIFRTRPVGSKVAFKLTWEGYAPYTKHKVAVRLRKGEVRHVTRREVLRQVAEVVEAFIQENESYVPNIGDGKWVIGPERIRVENIAILGLRQVTKVGMQPILCYIEVNT